MESFPLAPWAQRRRQDLLELLDRLKPRIGELTTAAIEQEAERQPEARRLMTHPGVGPLTALAFWLIVGPVERFGCSKQVSTYLAWSPARIPAGGVSSWDTSASRATRCCASCWWRRRKPWSDAIRSGEVASCTW